MFSSIVLFAMSLCWAKYSPSNIIDQDPRIFFWTMGTVFSNIAMIGKAALLLLTSCLLYLYSNAA
uniref:Uncharacterized protein n=1 Tax=Parascaris equorum TaxID=6256 RepID=A0A914RGE3_PAREQ